ncbi:hypothetical protein [Prosthecobacter sp.]|uniref:hypothetical protein n=1 Tax=Prosthecobacter sp. TaxID=1965333 RepID=UPI00378421BF
MSSRISFGIIGITAIALAAMLYSQLHQSAATARAIREKTAEEAPSVQTPLPPAPVILPDLVPARPAPAKKGKPPPQDPAARAALSLVGKDATAEQIWLEAINNPNLPRQERSDLIEDLNEDGFSNRKQPTPADLPLIEARLKLIERLMPEATDETNLNAFGEARKDLINLRAKLGQ